MRNKYAANHVLLRDSVFYYVRRVPLNLAKHYSVKRLCFSLRTKSYKSAIHASKSVSQRLEDYWLGLRLQKIDIPALQLVKSHDVSTEFLMSIGKVKHDKCLYTYLYNITYMYHLTMRCE